MSTNIATPEQGVRFHGGATPTILILKQIRYYGKIVGYIRVSIINVLKIGLVIKLVKVLGQ